VIFFYIANQVWLLNLILGFAFLYVALRMVYEGIIKRKMPERTGNQVPGSKSSKGAIGFFIGIITGIVGLGGGYALVPSFIYLLSSPCEDCCGNFPSIIHQHGSCQRSVQAVSGHS